MKRNFLFGLLLLGQLAYGQSETPVKIPGTKCSIVPPAGFTASTSFSGFQHSETGASIMVNEIPAAYQMMVDGFTADALKTKGMTLLSKQTIDFNNSKASLLNISQPANGMVYLKQMLVFGDATHTVLVNGIYPEASKSIETAVKKALLSTVYDAAQDENPLAAAPFSIDVTNTALKLVKYMSGTLLYSADGKMPTEKPVMIVGNSLAKIPAVNQKQYAEARIKKLPNGDKIVVKQISDISINNLKGYEIIADGKTKDNKPELVYQVMLFNETGDYFMILGQASEEVEKNLETFKQVAKTFKRK